MKKIGAKKIIVAAVVLALGIGAVAAGVVSSTPKLVFEGVRLKNVGGNIQAEIDVNLCSVNTVGASFVMEYDPAIVVPSTFDSNSALAEGTTKGVLVGDNTFRCIKPNRDIFPRHDITVNPSPGNNPLREGNALGGTYMTQSGKKAVMVNLTLDNEYTPKAGENWLKVRNIQEQPGGPEVRRLELDASKSQGTRVVTLSFQVKNPAAFVKLSQDELKNVFKLSTNKNGTPNGSVAYIDEDKIPNLQYMSGNEFIDYEFNLRATIDKIRVDIAGFYDDYNTIKTTASEIYDKGTGDDLLTYLNSHACDITVKYIGGAEIADSIVWGAPGTEFNVRNYHYTHLDDFFTWKPKGGAYLFKQIYKRDAEQGDIYIEAILEVDPVKVVGYTSDNPEISYDLSTDELPSSIDDPLMRFPEKARPVFDRLIPAFGNYEISVKKDTWEEKPPIFGDFFARPPQSNWSTFVAQVEESELPEWATPDVDPLISVARCISEKTEPGEGFDASRDISASVDDEGVLAIEINTHLLPAEYTIFVIRMPNGEIIDARKLITEPNLPESPTNGKYEKFANQDAEGNDAPGIVTFKISAPEKPKGINMAYQFRAMQHINLGKRLGKWSIQFRHNNMWYTDEFDFDFEPRKNSYTGTEFFFDYSGAREPLFKYELGTVLPNRVRLAGEDHVLTVYNGTTGVEPGELNVVEVDDAGWRTDQIIKAEGNNQPTLEVGDTVVFKGQLADAAYYPGWGTVHNSRNPKDTVTLKLTVSQRDDPAAEEMIEPLYDFVYDTQKTKYTSDKLQTKVFTVKNVGDTTIRGGKILIEPIGETDAPFEIASPLPKIIRPGETAQFSIRTVLNAGVALHEANVKIASNSGAELDTFKISFKVTENDVYRVTVNVNDEDYGTARTGEAVPPALTPYASYTYEEGDTVSLTAIPAPSAAFGSWRVLKPAAHSVVFMPNASDTSVTFLMPASDVTVNAVFEEALVAKLGLENLKILGENGDVKQLKVKDSVTGELTNTIFDSTIKEYHVVLPYEADKVKAEVTLKNAQIEVDGEIKDVAVSVSYNPGVPNIALTKLIGTDKTYISELIQTSEPPLSGTIIVTVTLPEGGEQGQDLSKVYRVHVKRLINKGDMAGFVYGNSPYGLIMRDDSISESDKDVYKQQFIADDYRFIKANLPNKKLPAKAEAVSGLWYNPRAWNKPGSDEFVEGGANYDLDDYAVFAYSRDYFILPGVKYLKQSDGTPITNPQDVTRTLKLKVLPGSTLDFSQAVEREIMLPQIQDFSSVHYDQTCRDLLIFTLLPGIYEIVYSYPDYDGTTAKVSRPFIVLADRGDVNISAQAVSAPGVGLDYMDKQDILTRFTRMLYFNDKGTGYPYGNLYRYRICDINNDGNVNDADAYAIDYINVPFVDITRFYPQLAIY